MTKPKIAIVSGSLWEENLFGKRVKQIRRCHYYETQPGYLAHKLKQMTESIFEARQENDSLQYLFLLNTVGSFHKKCNIGDLAVITDHIDQIGNPLLYWRGKQGIQVPNSKDVYSEELREMAKKIAYKKDIPIHEGVFLTIKGPTINTPAERAFYSHYCDFVGMSGSTEAIFGRALGLQVLLVGLITDNEIPNEILDVRTIIKQHRHKLKTCVEDLVNQLS